MAFLNQLTRPQIAQQLAEEYASAATIPADTAPGSDLGSIFNADALLAIILQQQVAYVNSIARLSTIGPNPTNAALPNPDVDSFVNAYGVFRLEATAAQGQVVFSIGAAASLNIFIPAVPAGTTGGVVVQTQSGIQYQVVIDTSNVNYSTTFQSYVLSAGQMSVSCTVQCLSLGVNGNAQANQITQLFSGPGVTSLAGISSVNNPLAFSNAAALETDSALKIRFAITMQTGTSATASAEAAALLSTALSLTYSIGDQLNAVGAADPGFFTVVVAVAGSGATPSPALLAQVTAACLAVKPLGITMIGANPPTLVGVNITANIKVAAGANPTATVAACTAAFQAFVNNIGLSPTGLTTLCSIAATYFTLMSVPNVVDVTSLQLNGGTSDLNATFGQMFMAGTSGFTPF